MRIRTLAPQLDERTAANYAEKEFQKCVTVLNEDGLAPSAEQFAVAVAALAHKQSNERH